MLLIATVNNELIYENYNAFFIKNALSDKQKRESLPYSSI